MKCDNDSGTTRWEVEPADVDLRGAVLDIQRQEQWQQALAQNLEERDATTSEGNGLVREIAEWRLQARKVFIIEWTSSASSVIPEWAKRLGWYNVGLLTTNLHIPDINITSPECVAGCRKEETLFRLEVATSARGMLSNINILESRERVWAQPAILERCANITDQRTLIRAAKQLAHVV